MEDKQVTPEYVMNYLKKEGLKNPEPELIKVIFETMKKYEGNFWWESNDLAMIGFYQLMEERMIVNFSKFHEGLEKLLDRPVWTHEMGLNYEGLKKEATQAIELYLSGIKHSDEYRNEKTKESIQMLEDFCKKNGKQILKIDLNKENPNDERDENGIDNSGYDGWLK